MEQSVMRPKAQILTIGDELLKGSTLNTNARFLGLELTSLGFHVWGQRSCPDQEDMIGLTLSELLDESDLVVLTGGLGPTPDDVTREAVAAFCHAPLRFSRRQYERIIRHFRLQKKRVPSVCRKEAMFPSKAVPLENKAGIALGFYLPLSDGKMLVVLPGVPREQEKMFKELVSPLLKRTFRTLPARHAVVARIVGLSEPAIIQSLGRGFFTGDFEFGIYPYPGEAIIRIDAPSARKARLIRQVLKKKISRHIYAFEDIELPAAIGRLLKKKGLTLSVAESCTGGRLSAEAVQAPGASAWFEGGVVAYQNEVKIKELGVKKSTLVRKGAVSSETAAGMARGVREKLDTSYGLSVTGIAGPEGGSRKKPVGTVYIGLSRKQGDRVWKHRFSGDRETVQKRAARKALEYLWRDLSKVF